MAKADDSTAARAKGPVEGHPEGVGEYADLLRVYGEAMLRIGKLETKVDQLMELIAQGSNPGEGVLPEPKGLKPLEERLEALHNLVSDPGGQPGPAPERERDAELGQMRLQIANLANQLTRAQQHLKETRENRSRGRRRQQNPSKPLWRRLARRPGAR